MALQRYTIHRGVEPVRTLMSGPLNHSPAYVLRQGLVDLGLGTNPADGAAWPVFARKEPDKPDEVVTVYNTAGRDLGRTAPDQERTELYGIQVRVRSGAPDVGDAKARAIALALDKVYRRQLLVDGVVYLVTHFQRTSGVLDAGTDAPTTSRSVFTVNGLLSLSMV